MLNVENLSKKFKAKQALNDVTFTAPNGRVTGFLGPNGAGKSTTMRCLLGLIHPDSGRALIDGHDYTRSPSPLSDAGAVLDAKSSHKGRTALAHLRGLAMTHGIPNSRVDEVIDMAGLTSVRKQRTGGFSLGMGQRLSIAAALLGDPHNLILDEPINGLDPEGVKWVRDLCRYYASIGRTVLLSSHLMSEVAMTADDLVIIGRGRILAQTTVKEFIDRNSTHRVRISTSDPQALLSAAAVVDAMTVTPIQGSPNDFFVDGIPLAHLSELLVDHGVAITHLEEETASLEDAYLALTHDSVEYATGGSDPNPQAQPNQEAHR